jgi:acetyltransferase-like isoleucine patch superfamily enzyme
MVMTEESVNGQLCIAPDVKLCKISSHTFFCEGVSIEDNVFIGHGVTFINDSYPRATASSGELQTEADWKVEATLVKKGASIGSGATILSNVVIGENAIVGAGSVVTHASSRRSASLDSVSAWRTEPTRCVWA